MTIEERDWRLSGQESYLYGAVLVWKPYSAPAKRWDHDHCKFCWSKFIDPSASEAHRVFVEEHPETLTEGYTTTSEYDRGADYHWVCKRCFEDFAGMFAWRVERGPATGGD